MWMDARDHGVCMEELKLSRELECDHDCVPPLLYSHASAANLPGEAHGRHIQTRENKMGHNP